VAGTFRLIFRIQSRLIRRWVARVGSTTPKQLSSVTGRESMVKGMQTRVGPRGYFPDASVDPTEARNVP
jgi:hypothetical protein